MPIEDIEKADQTYKKRIRGLSKRKRRRKKKSRRKKKNQCFWTECSDPISGLELCTKHKAKYYSGTLLKLDHTAFPYEEMIDLYKDVIDFAIEMEIPVETAAVWLLAEGLNSYESKMED